MNSIATIRPLAWFTPPHTAIYRLPSPCYPASFGQIWTFFHRHHYTPRPPLCAPPPFNLPIADATPTVGRRSSGYRFKPRGIWHWYQYKTRFALARSRRSLAGPALQAITALHAHLPCRLPACTRCAAFSSALQILRWHRASPTHTADCTHGIATWQDRDPVPTSPQPPRAYHLHTATSHHHHLPPPPYHMVVGTYTFPALGMVPATWTLTVLHGWLHSQEEKRRRPCTDMIPLNCLQLPLPTLQAAHTSTTSTGYALPRRPHTFTPDLDMGGTLSAMSHCSRPATLPLLCHWTGLLPPPLLSMASFLLLPRVPPPPPHHPTTHHTTCHHATPAHCAPHPPTPPPPKHLAWAPPVILTVLTPPSFSTPPPCHCAFFASLPHSPSHGERKRERRRRGPRHLSPRRLYANSLRAITLLLIFLRVLAGGADFLLLLLRAYHLPPLLGSRDGSHMDSMLTWHSDFLRTTRTGRAARLNARRTTRGGVTATYSVTAAPCVPTALRPPGRRAALYRITAADVAA